MVLRSREKGKPDGLDRRSRLPSGDRRCTLAPVVEGKVAALAKAPAAASPVLEINKLEKRYGVIEVLKSIDIDMRRGEFLVLVGPSGCGKSTLLNCIAGLDEVSGGHIVIGGRDVTEVPPRDRDIAMVFQSYALYPTMTVRENIAFGMKVRNVPKPQQEVKTREVANLLRIDHLLDRKPAHLSGGQRQRVAMGRALVREPVLFLFDEPLSNLDAKLRVEMRAEIKRLHERLGASIVYVTHDQIEAMTLGTRIVVLNQGVIQQIGTPDEIYRAPANIFVADFMGSPPMNLIPATVKVEAAGKATLTFAGKQKLAVGGTPSALKAYDGQDLIVGIRPEAFHIAEGKTGLKLDAQLVENAGSDTFATFEIGGKALTARLPGKARIEGGKPVVLSIDVEGICYFDPKTELRIG
jgi:multiple sugar transport system ATP-binding protein